MFQKGTVLAVCVSLLLSCGPSEKDLLKAELEKTKQENAEFKAKNSEMNVSLESYSGLLKEISNNLNLIDENAAMNLSQKKEMKSDAVIGEQILSRIKHIHALMENSKIKIQALDRTLNELRKKFGAQSEQVLELSKELQLAAQELVQREIDFNNMKSEYEGEIEGLESAYQTQLKIAEDLKEMMDRAFYIHGSGKVLKEKGILESEGGFIGLGKVKVLNASSPDRMFTKISKDQAEMLLVKAKKIELITDHIESSYKVDQTDSTCVLVIKDKKSFWKQSNYLVIKTIGKED